MANHLLNKAWEVRLSPKQKLVLVSLADRANKKTGKCFAGMADHMKRTGLSECSVRRAIHELTENQQISVQLRTGTSSLYTVHPCQADTSTPVCMTAPEGSDRYPTPIKQAANPCQADTQTREPSLNQAPARFPDERRAPQRAHMTPEQIAEMQRVGPLKYWEAQHDNGDEPASAMTQEGGNNGE
jgi:hypothetical protein